MACSMVLMVTGWFSRLSVQASSQGAGQMRPVNSGKLLVECRLRAASSQSSLEDEVVPVRDLVVHRAARRAVAERDAAIHAARRLLLQVAVVERQRELAEMAYAFAGELILLLLPVVFEKACDLAHRIRPGCGACPCTSLHSGSPAAWATPPPPACDAISICAAPGDTRPASPSRTWCGRSPNSSRIALARAEPV